MSLWTHLPYITLPLPTNFRTNGQAATPQLPNQPVQPDVIPSQSGSFNSRGTMPNPRQDHIQLPNQPINLSDLRFPPPHPYAGSMIQGRARPTNRTSMHSESSSGRFRPVGANINSDNQVILYYTLTLLTYAAT